MSNGKDQNQDLTPFEAALAWLRPRPDRLDPRGRSMLADEASRRMLAAADQPAVREVPCVASGHVFACVYCGAPTRSHARARRWIWPAAFSAMTAIAAALLVAIAVRPEEQAQTNSLAAMTIPLARATAAPDEMCYLAVRRQVLLHGVDSWKPPVSDHVGPTLTDEAPVSYREQLERLLKRPECAAMSWK